MRGWLLALLLLACPVGARSDVFTTSAPIPGAGGLKGIQIDRPAGDPYCWGIDLSLAGTACWNIGMDVTQDYPGIPDLVLAFNPATHSDQLRIRSDTGQVTLGPTIGHPVWPYQLCVTPAPNLGGMMVGSSGWTPTISLFNTGQNDHRTTVNFAGDYCFQDDSGNNQTGDFYLYSWLTQSYVYYVDASGGLRVDAPKVGFYRSPPVAQPVVTGSWSDGAAAKSVLAALVQLGLVKDQTTQ